MTDENCVNKLLFRLDTDEIEKIDWFAKKMNGSESIVVPKYVEMWYKGKDGLWHNADKSEEAEA